MPWALRSYLLATCAAWLAATAVALAVTAPSSSHLLTYLVLLGCGSLAVEATRRQGEPAGVLAQDLLSAWFLPIALVLPPVYSLFAPLPLMALVQWRVRPAPTHRRVFSAASLGLAYAGASGLFHWARSTWMSAELIPGLAALLWVGLAILSAVIGVVTTLGLIAIAVKASDPEVTWRELMWDRERLVVDWGEQATGVLIAMACLLHPLLAVLALTPIILMQRGVLHDQLSAAARLDAKTQLLNAVTWERETAGEIARAARTGNALSVMLLDLDHFKPVNDRFGHLAGDDVLRAVANVLKTQTREYDLCARFGGDEFAILLPQSDLAEGQRTARRIQRHVAGIAVPVGSEYVRVSVSVGVAELTSPTQEVTDLLAAADSELYRAKASRSPAQSLSELPNGDRFDSP